MTPTSPLCTGIEVMARLPVEVVGWAVGDATGVDCAGLVLVLDGLLSGDVLAVCDVPLPNVHAAAKSTRQLKNPSPLPTPLIFR